MNHAEMTKHIRSRVKAAGIKARVYKDVCCGSNLVVVSVPNAETTFTETEQIAIAMIGLCNKLTYVRGMPILPYATTKPQQFKFYMPETP